MLGLGLSIDNTAISGAASGAAKDPSFASVVLLMGFEGLASSTSFVDESAFARAMTAVGNAQIATAQFKFGTASALFDGSGDAITALDSNDWDFGSGDFTVEFFVRHNSTGSMGYVEQYTGSGNRAWTFIRESGTYRFFSWIGGGRNDLITAALTPTVGQWYHFLAERASGTSRMFIDGVMAAKASTPGALDGAASPLAIGRGLNGIYSLDGWIDELRITKGVARCGSDAGFSVPAAPYPGS